MRLQCNDFSSGMISSKSYKVLLTLCNAWQIILDLKCALQLSSCAFYCQSKFKSILRLSTYLHRKKIHLEKLSSTPASLQRFALDDNANARQIIFPSPFTYSNMILSSFGVIYFWSLTFQYQQFHACFRGPYNLMQSYNSQPKSRTNREKFSFMSSSENIYCLDGETFCLVDSVAFFLRWNSWVDTYREMGFWNR